MAKVKTVYICNSCGSKYAKWQGKCPACNEWNTLTEDVEVVSPKAKSGKSGAAGASVLTLDKVQAEQGNRLKTGINELDMVLGGGFVQGSVVLIGGDPGIGKSTLILDCCDRIKNLGKSVLYVTGEESAHQIKLRADRLEIKNRDLEVLCENNVEKVLSLMDGRDFVVIDSIQTMSSDEISSSLGSISQIRECSSMLIRKAKEQNICVILVGHVTKDGAIAGPKVLEHMVDTVLYFEGEKHQMLRILRTQKNRFGSTNEVGVFEMTAKGIKEADNASDIFLGDGQEGKSGCAIVCAMEGTRPILMEVQALLTPTVYGQPRRMSDGIDNNRLILLLAVLEKKLKLPTGRLDCYINVAGGISINGPESDLGVCVAIVSSIRDMAVSRKYVFIGEVGLSGEIRFVGNIGKRINECRKMGFERIFVPKSALKGIDNTKDIVGCSSLVEVFKQVFRSKEA
ncbi:MAG: DNA repair protein RadA [Clostridia bacterium]|nr:DNA repair protein RadA [Clostridia bacterium]